MSGMWGLWTSTLTHSSRKSLSTGSDDPEINEEYRRMYVALVKAISSYDKGDRANNIKKLQIQQKDKASRRSLYGDLRETNAKTKREYIKYLSRARSGLLKQQEAISKAAAENVEPIVAPVRRATRSSGGAREGWGSLFESDSAFDNTSKIDRLGDAEKAAAWDRLMEVNGIGVRVISENNLEFQPFISDKLQANITDFYQQAQRAKNSLDRDRAQIQKSLTGIDESIAGLSKGDANQRLAPQEQAAVDATMDEFAQSEASLDRLAGYDASKIETELTQYNEESRSMKTMRDRLEQMDAQLGSGASRKKKQLEARHQLLKNPHFHRWALDRGLNIGSAQVRPDGTIATIVGPDFAKATSQFHFEARRGRNNYGALRKRRTGETVLIIETLPEDRDLTPYRATSGENAGKLIYSRSFDGSPKLLKASDLKSMQDSGKFASMYRVNEGKLTGALVTVEGRVYAPIKGILTDITYKVPESMRQITPGMSKVYLTNEDQEPLRYFTEEDIGKKGLTPAYDDGIVSLEGLDDYQIEYSDEPIAREAMTVGFKLRQHAADSAAHQMNGEDFFEIETGPTNRVERFDPSTSRQIVLTGPVERLSMSDISAMARKKVDPEMAAEVLAGIKAGVDFVREPREGPLKKLFNQFAIRDLGRAAPEDIAQRKKDEERSRGMAEISRIDAQRAKFNREINQITGPDSDYARSGFDPKWLSDEDSKRLQDINDEFPALENRKREIYSSLDMAGEDIDVEAFGRSAEPLGTGQEEAIEEGEKKRGRIFGGRRDREWRPLQPPGAVEAGSTGGDLVPGLTVGDPGGPKIGGGTRPEPSEEGDDATALAGSDTRKVDDMGTDLGLWRRAADAPEEVELERNPWKVLGSWLSNVAKGKDVDVPKEEPTVIVEDLPDGSETKDEGLDEETLKKIKQAEEELELEESQGVGR